MAPPLVGRLAVTSKVLPKVRWVCCSDILSGDEQWSKQVTSCRVWGYHCWTKMSRQKKPAKRKRKEIILRWRSEKSHIKNLDCSLYVLVCITLLVFFEVTCSIINNPPPIFTCATKGKFLLLTIKRAWRRTLIMLTHDHFVNILTLRSLQTDFSNSSLFVIFPFW